MISNRFSPLAGESEEKVMTVPIGTVPIRTDEEMPEMRTVMTVPIRTDEEMPEMPIRTDEKSPGQINHLEVMNTDCEGVLHELAHGDDHPDWMAVDTYVDSGAARSVCPLVFCQHFPITPSEQSKKGQNFRTAGGEEVRNEGDRRILGVTQTGRGINMKYAVADVTVPLDSVSQLCDAGNTVVFTAKGGT